MNTTIITAHSGCEGTQPDTIESVLAGIRSQAACVEVDVRLTDNGELVLSHDKRDSYENAASLASVFKIVREANVRVNCDLKEPSALYPVLELAGKLGIDGERLILSGSVSCDLLASDPAISPKAAIYLNIEEILKYLLLGGSHDARGLLASPWEQIKPVYERSLDERADDIARLAKSVGADVVNFPFRALTSARIAELRARGLELSIWTVNGEEDLLRFLGERPANITTLKPRLAARLLTR